jgi:hypothetical protein
MTCRQFWRQQYRQPADFAPTAALPTPWRPPLCPAMSAMIFMAGTQVRNQNASTDFAGQRARRPKRLQGQDRFWNSSCGRIHDLPPMLNLRSSARLVPRNRSAQTVNISYALSDVTAADTWLNRKCRRRQHLPATTTVSASVRSNDWQQERHLECRHRFGQDLSTMRVRVRSRDYFGNQARLYHPPLLP